MFESGEKEEERLFGSGNGRKRRGGGSGGFPLLLLELHILLIKNLALTLGKDLDMRNRGNTAELWRVDEKQVIATGQSLLEVPTNPYLICQGLAGPDQPMLDAWFDRVRELVLLQVDLERIDRTGRGRRRGEG